MVERLQRGGDAQLHLGRGGVAADPRQVELQRRQRAADVVVDLARDRRPFHFDAGLQVLRQFGQPLARRRELGVGEHARLVVAVGLDRIAHRRGQARQVVLQQIVRRAVAHRGHRGVLADLARQQHERQHRPFALEQLERLCAGEPGHVEVRQHHVPRPPGQRLAETVFGVDPHRLYLEARSFELRARQLMVDLGVFQVQHAQHLVRATRVAFRRRSHGA